MEYNVAYLIGKFSLAQGGPVPDGMEYMEISEDVFPSNVDVFTASNMEEAVLKALHAFRHGKQGAVWLTDNRLRNMPETDVFETQDKEDAINKFVEAQLVQLKKYDPSEQTMMERSYEFYPHHDSMPIKLSEHFRSPKVDSVRVVINFIGEPTIIFGRNSVLSAKINSNIVPSVEDFGTAYICPKGSVLFILGGNAGLRNSLLHSSPNVPFNKGYPFVRRLSVIDLFTSP